MSAKRCTLIISGALAIAVGSAICIAMRPRILEMWYLYKARHGQREERGEAICNLIHVSGIKRAPELMRIWVEDLDMSVLIDWNSCIENLDTEEAMALGVDNNEDGPSGINSGALVEVSTDGTVFAMHGFVMVNPVPLYEQAYGSGSWPPDMPIERLKAPRQWIKRE
jgi:hypothetical protein